MAATGKHASSLGDWQRRHPRWLSADIGGLDSDWISRPGYSPLDAKVDESPRAVERVCGPQAWPVEAYRQGERFVRRWRPVPQEYC